METLIKKLLSEHPAARERRARGRAVWYVLKNSHHFDVINYETFLKVYSEIDSIRRAIYQIQVENPSFRGLDWNDGKRLKQEKQISLGYEGGYHTKLPI